MFLLCHDALFPASTPRSFVYSLLTQYKKKQFESPKYIIKNKRKKKAK